MEKPENDGETQVPDVRFLSEGNKISVAVYMMENTEYLNILRGVVKDTGSVNEGAKNVQNSRKTDGVEDFEDSDAENDNDSIEEIKNIAELIPNKSFEDTMDFQDVYIMGNTTYRYCIRYRVNGVYYFSGWSKKVDVPEGKGMTSPLYIVENENGADSLNIEYNEENGTMTIRTIKDSLLSGEFDENTERFNEEEIEVNKYTEENETEFTVSLVFHYEENENITSRAFSIESLVNEYSMGGSLKYYISSTNATNYNISVLVTPDFYGKNVVVDGFIGEQITKFEKKVGRKLFGQKSHQ